MFISVPVVAVKLDSPSTMVAGELSEVHCTAWGSYPPPAVYWFLGDKRLLPSTKWVSIVIINNERYKKLFLHYVLSSQRIDYFNKVWELDLVAKWMKNRYHVIFYNNEYGKK